LNIRKTELVVKKKGPQDGNASVMGRIWAEWSPFRKLEKRIIIEKIISR
jgi:hypothetical protein